MSAKITASADGTYGSLGVGAIEFMRFGADTSGQLTGFRNKIINGGMLIWQRGNSINCPNSAGTYTADRWMAYGVGANFSVERIDNAQNQSWLQINGASGLTVVGINQRIEADNMSFASGSKLMLSFDFGSSSGTYSVDVSLNGPNTEDTAPYSVVLAQATVSLTGYQHVIIPLTLTADMYKGCELSIYINGLGANQALLRNIQLEQGSIATPFEQRPIGLELDLSRRYFRRYATAQNTSDLGYQMRLVPTQSGSGPYNYSAEL